MIEYIFRPIDKWPRAFTKDRRKRAPFHTHETRTWQSGGTYTVKAPLSFDRIVRELSNEVERHGAKRVIIQLALDAAKIRRDGLPYSEARPEHPGVIVSFETKNGPVKMPCDAFTDWKDNLRAIHVTLEHLRGIDRYGVSQHGEQYRGWQALPPGPGGAPRMTLQDAAAFINQHVPFVSAEWIADRKDAFDIAYRQAAKALHPDAGGDEETFKQLQTAAEVLRAHHGVTE